MSMSMSMRVRVIKKTLIASDAFRLFGQVRLHSQFAHPEYNSAQHIATLSQVSWWRKQRNETTPDVIVVKTHDTLGRN
jgi:hypothetical protein